MGPTFEKSNPKWCATQFKCLSQPPSCQHKTCRKAASTPQKHPAPKVAFSISLFPLFSPSQTSKFILPHRRASVECPGAGETRCSAPHISPCPFLRPGGWGTDMAGYTHGSQPDMPPNGQKRGIGNSDRLQARPWGTELAFAYWQEWLYWLRWPGAAWPAPRSRQPLPRRRPPRLCPSRRKP